MKFSEIKYLSIYTLGCDLKAGFYVFRTNKEEVWWLRTPNTELKN